MIAVVLCCRFTRLEMGMAIPLGEAYILHIGAELGYLGLPQSV